MRYALGLVEAIGLATAYEAADAAVKAANVELLGLEACRGDGMHTIKLLGDVGAVKAGVAAAQAACAKGRGCFSATIIARPAEQLEPMVHNEVTIGAHSPKTQLPSIVMEDYEKYNQEADTQTIEEVVEEIIITEASESDEIIVEETTEIAEETTEMIDETPDDQ